MRYHLLALIMLLPIAANAETPLSLKGIQMGDSREKVEQILGEPLECERDYRVESYSYCDYVGMTFAGRPGVKAFAIYFQGDVYYVGFSFIVEAHERLNLVAEKYGRPDTCHYGTKCSITIERPPVQLSIESPGNAYGSVSLRDRDVTAMVEDIRNPPPKWDKDDI